MTKKEATKKLSKEELAGIRQVFNETKARAKKEGVGFHLTFQDLCDKWIEQDGCDYYTGIPLTLPKAVVPNKHELAKGVSFLCKHLLKNPKLDFFAIFDVNGDLVCRCLDCKKRLDTDPKNYSNVKEMAMACDVCVAKHLGVNRIVKRILR